MRVGNGAYNFPTKVSSNPTSYFNHRITFLVPPSLIFHYYFRIRRDTLTFENALAYFFLLFQGPYTGSLCAYVCSCFPNNSSSSSRDLSMNCRPSAAGRKRKQALKSSVMYFKSANTQLLEQELNQSTNTEFIMSSLLPSPLARQSGSQQEEDSSFFLVGRKPVQQEAFLSAA